MHFNSLNASDIDRLRQIFGGRLTVGDDIVSDFGHDEMGSVVAMPEALVQPVSRDEVVALMRYANERRIPVTPRGQGTGLVGGCVPLYGGILLDLSKMNRIISLDEDNLSLVVEAGVLLMEVSQFVEERGLFYPPDPGEKSATIGGNISTNAGGMRAVKYGVTRDYVRGLEVVLPDGQVVAVGGNVVKNSSGYALKDLFVGAEGTLGVITQATLKLLPLPQTVVSLLVPFPSLEMAIDTVPEIIRSRSTPTAVEFMERGVIAAAERFLGREFPDSSADAYLLLSFDGNSSEEVERAYEEVAELCLAHGAIDVFISATADRQETIWSARGAFLEAIKAASRELEECDVVVPRAKVAEFIRFTREVEQGVGLKIMSFGHAGDGNLHVYMLRGDQDDSLWPQLLHRAMEMLYRRATELGGKVSGEHGIGRSKLPYLAQEENPVIMELMRGIKRAFDPHGILNPGKIVL